jgi:hypothetical protein
MLTVATPSASREVSMSRRSPLYQWTTTVATRFPKLSKPLASALALYSFGMVLAHACGLSAVALALTPLLGRSDNTVRQRLREFYQEADAKRGRRRAELDVAACFAPLLGWILGLWPERRLALALDVTNLADRFHVLAVSVVYRGCAIPVAWKVLPGNQKGEWHPHWCALLARLHQALDGDWQVVVLSDRGLESQRLFEASTALGWHPLMRVKAHGQFRPSGWRHFYPMAGFVPSVGRRFVARGEAYKTASPRLACVLLACWEAGHAEPWLLLTDLAPGNAAPCWYAFRSWIEQGFKVLKRAGWQWQRTRMTDAGRAERLWLAVAVATLWLVSVGGVAEAAVAATVGVLREGGERPRRQRRLHRVFRRGLAVLVAAWVEGQPPPPLAFLPEPWPEPWHELQPAKEEEFRKNTYP